MTVDELIKKLTQIQNCHGDADVVIIHGQTGWADDLDAVTVEEDSGRLRVALFQHGSVDSWWGRQ